MIALTCQDLDHQAESPALHPLPSRTLSLPRIRFRHLGRNAEAREAAAGVLGYDPAFTISA